MENAQVGVLNTPDSLISLSLNSNINIWSHADIEAGSKHPTDVIQGHSNYVNNLAFADGILVSSDIDGKIFSWTRDTVIPLAASFKGDGQTIAISILESSNDIVFSGIADGTIKRSFRVSPDSHIYEYKNSVKVSAAPLAVTPSADKKGLYVLMNNNKVALLDGETFTVAKESELKGYEATSITYTAVTNELWVGDKKGTLHILDANDFS